MVKGVGSRFSIDHAFGGAPFAYSETLQSSQNTTSSSRPDSWHRIGGR
jgi:hypothetical protein